MCLIQKIQVKEQTFSQLAESVLTQILHEGASSQRIDVVFHVYQGDSIKNAERENQAPQEVQHHSSVILHQATESSTGESSSAAQLTRQTF